MREENDAGPSPLSRLAFVDDADLRAVMLNAEDELAVVCASVLNVIESREQGRELLEFNLVDVTVDCDGRVVTVETCLAIDDLPVVSMSHDQFIELARPFSELLSQEERNRLKRERQGRLRGWPLPGPMTDAG